MELTTFAGAAGHAPALAYENPSHQEADQQEVLCFRVGNELYGVNILPVQEIRSFEAPTRLFGAPADTLGVLDLRGTIVTLIDARIRLGAPASIDTSTVTIVFRLDGHHIGLVVDQVADVQRLTNDDIRPAPRLGDGTVNIGVTGLSAASDKSLLILLDVRTFLNTFQRTLLAN